MERSFEHAVLLLSNHRVVLPWCTQAPWLLLSYQWKMLTVKTSMFLLQRIILSETCCGRNAEAAENGHILFKLVSVFQSSLTHSRVAHATHQAGAIKTSQLCACVQFQHSS
jgi:hypothetical protein